MPHKHYLFLSLQNLCHINILFIFKFAKFASLQILTTNIMIGKKDNFE